MMLINIGKIITTWGNKGEVKVTLLTDFPDRFQNLKRFYLVRRGQKPVVSDIENAWFHKGFIILKFKDYDSISQAEELKGFFIAIPKEERMKLKKDEYYIDEVMGLEVENEEGKRLGKIIDVVRNPGNDVYVVKNDKELWIPAIKEVIKKIDLENEKMVIHMVEGLESL